MRFLLVLPLFALASGCSLVQTLVGKGRATLEGPIDPVVPGQILDGEAARLQDSLRPRLTWLATHGSRAYPASRIAFRNTGDSSTPVLVVEADEATRINSRGSSADQTARLQARRILATRPWALEAATARIQQPLVVRIAFRHRNFLRQNDRFVDDTIEVRYADSTVSWKGSPLDL
jgi:hypothetical protein